MGTKRFGISNMSIFGHQCFPISSMNGWEIRIFRKIESLQRLSAKEFKKLLMFWSRKCSYFGTKQIFSWKKDFFQLNLTRKRGNDWRELVFKLTQDPFVDFNHVLPKHTGLVRLSLVRILMFGTNSICYQHPKAGYET